MDDYAHLVNSYTGKSDKHANASDKSTANIPEEEQLSTDLSLFMSNMWKIDIDRRKQILAATITENALTETYILELESDGTDFHTIFKNQHIVSNEEGDLLLHSVLANLAIRGFILKD